MTSVRPGSGQQAQADGQALRAEIFASALRPVYTHWQVGEVRGEFKIKEVISDSLLACFYRATRARSDGTVSSVILMVTAPRLSELQKNLLESSREVMRKLMTLGEETLLPLDGCLIIDGCVVWEYSDSGIAMSLGRYVIEKQAANEYATEGEARFIMQQVATALQACRRVGIGHYFLTPDFVFLDAEGNVRVAGMGLFQSVEYKLFEQYVSAAINPILRLPGQMYRFTALEILSPEIRNEKRIDLRSDVYGLGMCGYFTLVGQKPVRRWTLPSSARQGIEAGWDLLLSHCLELNPAHRFASVGAFLTDLERLETLVQEPPKREGRVMRTISILPLPQFVEERFGLVVLFYIRLGLLATMGILSVGTGWLLYSIIAEEIPANYQGEVLARLPEGAPANWVLSFQPRQVKVTIRGPAVGTFMIHDGQLRLQAPTGRYAVRVESPYAAPFSGFLEASREPLEAEFALTIQHATLVVKGPPGTIIEAVGDKDQSWILGELDNAGQLTVGDRLFARSYNLRARRAGYFPLHWPKAVLDREQATVWEPQLVARPVEWAVRSEPVGARVVVAGAEVGVTPLTYTPLDFAPSAELTFELDGYRSQTLAFSGEPGEFRSLPVVRLTPQTGGLKLAIALPTPAPTAGAVARMQWSLERLDGPPTPLATRFADRGLPPRVAALPPGRWRLLVEHPQMVALERMLQVADGAEADAEVALVWKPANLALEVDGAIPLQLFVNSQSVALDAVPEFPPFVPVALTVIPQDYRPVQRQWTPQPGEQHRWQVPLQPLPSPQPGADWVPPALDVPMVWLPDGEFSLGSPVTEILRLPAEGPVTTVLFAEGFWMARHEVTQVVYERLMNSNPSRYRGARNPVDSVSWEDAVAFCARLTETERTRGRLPAGWIYRLPSEAEWEYAARAGTGGPFSFGDVADPSMGNFKGVYPRDHQPLALFDKDLYGSVAVGSYAANGWGLYDMHGNLQEWTLDSYIDRLPGGRATAPLRLDNAPVKAVRGGSWKDRAERVRSAAREGVRADSRRDSIGFRIVLARDPHASHP
jgi:formylglycine-generating enzyme required for sulfatase activity